MLILISSRIRAGVGAGSSGGDTLVHGASAAINGSGFGTGPTPIIYDDFSGGTDGNQILTANASGVGQWETGSGYEDMYYDAKTRGVHTKCAYHPFRSASPSANLCKNSAGWGSGTDLYVDYWQRLELIDQISRSFKTLRFYGKTSSGGGQDNYQIVRTHLGHNNPGPLQEDQIVAYETLDGANAGQTTTEYSAGVTQTAKNGNWVHHQYLIRFHASDFNDDRFINYENCVKYRDDGPNVNAVKVRANNTSFLNQFRQGENWQLDDAGTGLLNSGADVWSSCVHFQTGWARVELGDNATYGSCTIREIQRTTSWSGSAIDYVVNKGALSSGTVYEHVIDANNNVVQSTARTMT